MDEGTSQIRYLCIKLVNHYLNFFIKIIFLIQNFLYYSQLLPKLWFIGQQTLGVQEALKGLACHL